MHLRKEKKKKKKKAKTDAFGKLVDKRKLIEDLFLF